jgi:hypothetical protein
MADVNASPIALSPSLGDYFRAPIQDALAKSDLPSSVAIESYLVQLLSDFAKPNAEAASPLRKPATFLLHEALHAPRPERFVRLQSLGDGLLYELGFFGQSLPSSDRGYLVHVGSSAYAGAASMLRIGDGSRGLDVLGELARCFGRFVEVLVWVSDWVLAQSARGEDGVVVLYERWRKTGSAVLREALRARGVTGLESPSRASG